MSSKLGHNQIQSKQKSKKIKEKKSVCVYAWLKLETEN